MNFRDGKKSCSFYPSEASGQKSFYFTQNKAQPCRMLAHISPNFLGSFPYFSLKSPLSPMVFSHDFILLAVCSPLNNKPSGSEEMSHGAELWPEYYCIGTVILLNMYIAQRGARRIRRGECIVRSIKDKEQLGFFKPGLPGLLLLSEMICYIGASRMSLSLRMKNVS